jgi:tetratricopeptide (TPR) repeat protein
VGKTALAIQWARGIADRVPDGQLYIDLRGHAAGSPVQPIEALAAFLRALGVEPKRIPTDESEAAALYRSLLDGRRMLVLLDNAACAEQVRPLLPGTPTCVALVTSRNTLAGLVASNGVNRIGLDPLDRDDALGLLAGVIGADRVRAERAAAAELVDVCGGLPLALRIAAANLLDRPHESITAYVTQLGQHDPLVALRVGNDEHTAVAIAFNHSYERLDPSPRRLFRLLGLLEGPDFGIDVVARLLDSPQVEAWSMMQALLRGHLVENHAAGRYRMHDLLHLYAHRQATHDEPAAQRDQALHRVAAWYLSLARRARHLMFPALGGIDDEDLDSSHDEARALLPTAQQAQTWFITERPNLLATTRQALRPGTPSAYALLAGHLMHAVMRLIETQGPYDDWAPLLPAAIESAQAHRDATLATRLRIEHAFLLGDRGDHAAAADEFARAAADSAELGDRETELQARINVAVRRHLLGQRDEAAHGYRETLHLARATGNRRIEAYALANLAAVDRDLGRYPEAIDHAHAARDIFQLIDDWQGEADALGDAAESYSRNKDTGTAIARLREALALVAGRDRRREASGLHDLGVMLLKHGDHAGATRALRSAMRIYQELDAHDEAVAVQQTLATAGTPLGADA